jgi:multidrug efflux pump subunit AcrA (membrane-fusion protein)
MRFLRHSLTGLFLMSITLALVVYAATLVGDAVRARLADEPATPQARERVFAVNTVIADPQTVTPVLTAYGEIRSRRTLELRASASGTLTELADGFEDGATVTEGQVLARIDPANAQSVLDRAANDLRDAEIAARDAGRAVQIARDTLTATQEQADLQQRAYDRQVDLQARNVGSASAVETAEIAAAGARQSVLSARNALAQAETAVDTTATALNRARIARDEAQRTLDDTTIRAGFDGTLADVTAVEGGLVSANEQLATLIDATRLEVAFRLSTAQYSRLLDSAGRLMNLPLTATLDMQGIGLTVEGTITRDSASVGEGVTGRLVFARLDTPGGLKPGDFVEVAVEEPPLDSVALLPATAVDADNTVLAIGPDDRLRALPVTLLRRQGDAVLVRGDDIAGQRIVAQRSPLLGAGIKVRDLTERATPDTATPDPAEAEAELVELTPERREKLKAFITASNRMPEEMKTRILAQLDADRVPARMIERIESRIGG